MTGNGKTKRLSVLQYSGSVMLPKASPIIHPNVIPIQRQYQAKSGGTYILTPRVRTLASVTGDELGISDAQMLLGIASIVKALEFMALSGIEFDGFDDHCVLLTEGDEWLLGGFHFMRGATPTDGSTDGECQRCPYIERFCEYLTSFIAENFQSDFFPGARSLLAQHPTTAEAVLTSPQVRSARLDLVEGITHLATQPAPFYPQLADAVKAGSFSDPFIAHRLFPLLTDHISLGRGLCVPSIDPWCKCVDRLATAQTLGDLPATIVSTVAGIEARIAAGSVEEVTALAQSLAPVLPALPTSLVTGELLAFVNRVARPHLPSIVPLAKGIIKIAKDASVPRARWLNQVLIGAATVLIQDGKEMATNGDLTRHRMFLFHHLRISLFFRECIVSDVLYLNDLVATTIKSDDRTLLDLILTGLNLPEAPPGVTPPPSDPRRAPIVTEVTLDLVTAIHAKNKDRVVPAEVVGRLISALTLPDRVMGTVLSDIDRVRVRSKRLLTHLVLLDHRESLNDFLKKHESKQERRRSHRKRVGHSLDAFTSSGSELDGADSDGSVFSSDEEGGRSPVGPVRSISMMPRGAVPGVIIPTMVAADDYGGDDGPPPPPGQTPRRRSVTFAGPPLDLDQEPPAPSRLGRLGAVRVDG